MEDVGFAEKKKKKPSDKTKERYYPALSLFLVLFLGLGEFK
jgi:hypothetical protein